MSNQEDIELIEAYLNGLLSEDQRHAVEQRRTTDEAFEKEMKFQQQMHEHFRNEKRQRFRTLVQSVMEEHPVARSPLDPPAPGPFRRPALIWLAILAIVCVAGLFLWPWQHTSTTEPTGSKSQPMETPPQKALETKPDEAPPPAQPTEQKPAANPPIATADPVNFVPNASMEAFVQGETMSEGFTFNITNPRNGVAFVPDKNGAVALHFTGMVETMADEEPVSFKLSIFNNRETHKPLVSIPLDLQKEATGKFRFDIRRRLEAPPGLYYFTLDNQTGERAYTGKFTIGRLR